MSHNVTESFCEKLPKPTIFDTFSYGQDKNAKNSRKDAAVSNVLDVAEY